jgi:hypothetical protein
MVHCFGLMLIQPEAIVLFDGHLRCGIAQSPSAGIASAERLAMTGAVSFAEDFGV